MRRLSLWLCLTLTALPALAADPTFPGGLIYAHTPSWSTTLTAAANGPLGSTWTLDSGCKIGPVPTVTIPPGGAVRITHPTNFLCSVSDFGLIDAPGNATDMRSTLAFDDGLTTSYFAVPALGALYNDTAHLAVITNSEDQATYVAAYNAGDTPVYLSFQITSGDNGYTGYEQLAIPPKQLGFQRLSTAVDAGRVEVSEGCVVFGVVGCEARQPVYGFLAVGPISGTSAPMILPFAPSPFSVVIP